MSARISGLMGVILFLAACSSDSGSLAEPPVVETTAVEAAAVESVPTTEQHPLSETPVDVTLDSIEVGGDVATFAPAGWAVDVDGTATPPESSGLSGAVRWRIDDRCLDGCQERSGADWSALVGTADIDPLLADGQLTVVRDESTAGRRLVEVVNQDDLLTVVIVRWVDEASAYLRCDLNGEPAELDDLIPAFEFACDNTRAALAG